MNFYFARKNKYGINGGRQRKISCKGWRDMKKVLFWIIAFLITAATAFFQRLTGPTYPLRGKVDINDSQISYKLERSHESTSDYALEIKVQNREIAGSLLWKRHKTDEPWVKIPLARKDDLLVGSLPAQPPAGKLDYKVILFYREKETSLSGEKPVTIRFKGHVPAALLMAHVIIVFAAMLFSTRAGVEALDPGGNPRRLAVWTLGLLILGGIILGSLIQKLSFGQFWTGVPFGYDLTDNKTLIAVIGWIAAVVAGRGRRKARYWVLAASVLLLVINLIPHSLLGSELKYSKTTGPSFSP